MFLIMEGRLVLKGNFKNGAQFYVCLFCVFLFTPFKPFAQFSPGHIVVLQIGDGSTNLAGTGNAIVFKEYSTSGTPSFSLPIPTSGSQALILRGTASSEGYISLSADANYLVFGAYAKTLPNVTALNTSAASTINRGIGLISASGNYSLSAIAASPYGNGDIRGATASNSINMWSASSSQGSSYYGSNLTPGLVQNTKTNLRATHVFNQQLFISSQSGAGTPPELGIFSVGSGTPTISGQTVTTVINTGANSQPGQFYFNMAQSTCYIADARGGGAGGIQKWIKSAGTWSLAYTLPTGNSGTGAFGVIADFSGANPKIYATTTESINNRIIAIKDIGPISTATTLATCSASNTIFRGLVFSPGTTLCDPVSLISTSNNAPVCSQDTLHFTTAVVGSTPYTYLWQGQGVFSTSSSANPYVINSISGNYTLTASNACGTFTSIISVSINPSPTLMVNAPTICASGIATLNVSGASTYTWSNGSNGSSITVSPLTSTSYSVTGTSAQGCNANTLSSLVHVTNSLSISVNSATICAGDSALLEVNGASSYTWSNSSHSSSLFVAPLQSSNYTVTGSAPGCPSTCTAICQVFVNPLPILTISLTSAFVCESDNELTVLVSPTGGTLTGVALTGNIFAPAIAGIGTYSLIYTYSDSNYCTNALEQIITVDACVSISENRIPRRLVVFPNPSSGLFEVNLPFDQIILIYNSIGEIVSKGKYAVGWNQIDLNNLENGFYFLIPETSTDKSSMVRLVKMPP